MKSHLRALLMPAMLLLLPAGAAEGGADPSLPDPDLSPDGVALHDFAQDSAVWGRIFDFAPPEGVAESDIFSLCQFEGPGAGLAQWECLTPYVASVRWALPGTPGAWTDAPVTSRPVPGPVPDLLAGPVADTLPALPDVGVAQVADRWATFETGDFLIHDNIDCTPLCNKNADPYVVFGAWTSGGWSFSPATSCSAQDTSNGYCGAARSNNFLLVSLGANSCSGYKGTVEFKDEDGAVDDQMDISSRLSDGIADIEATIPAGSAPCNGEDSLWWSERTSTNSDPADRCHAVIVGFFCDLNGNGDTSGDNDDASLDFSTY